MTFNNYLEAINYILYLIKSTEDINCLICIDNIYNVNTSLYLTCIYQFIEKNRYIKFNCSIDNFNNKIEINEKVNILINEIENKKQIRLKN